MEAKVVAKAAGIDVGLLNAWVQRGQIPGMAVGAKGRLRDFSEEVATHIFVMAKIVKLGLGAPLASKMASEAQGRIIIDIPALRRRAASAWAA